MKKRFLSLILVLFLLPGAFFISACGKGGGYNLKNLSEDFYAIAKDENDNIVKNNNKVVFNYSHHIKNEEAYVNDAINSVETYSNLKKYNQVYENTLQFTFDYIDVCSKSDVEIDKSIRNSLQNRMAELHSKIKEVDACTNFFAGILKTTDEDKIGTATDCLTRYETLLISYENLFKSATQFNNELSNIYYNYVLTDSNPNVTAIEMANFDSTAVINRLDSRICWQISNLSTVFAEKYIIDSDMAQKIKAGQNLNLNPEGFEYLNMITSINEEINEDIAIKTANSEDYKQTFYQLASRAYRAQDFINARSSDFVYACNRVKYAQNNVNEFSSDEKICINIIDDFANSLKEYNNILVEMINII